MKPAQPGSKESEFGQPGGWLLLKNTGISLILSGVLLLGGCQEDPIPATVRSAGIFFENTRNYKLQSDISGIATGDLNLDGNPDAVVIHHLSGSPNVTILMGNRAAGFHVLGSLESGSFPTAAVLAHFNVDDFLDIAVANYGDRNVTVFLGDGNGGFSFLTNVDVQTAPVDLRAEDFDDDGNIDLVSASAGPDEIHVLFGNGAGSFPRSLMFSCGGTEPRLGTGDINQDGRIDILSGNTRNIVIFLNQSDGTFSAAADIQRPFQTTSIVVSDFNRDGIADIVAGSNVDMIAVMLGQEGGSILFGEPIEYPLGIQPVAVLPLDVDGDGRPDIVVTNANLNGPISVLSGLGNGAFATPAHFGTLSDPFDLVSEDLNLDGRPDLILVNSNNPNLSVMLNFSSQPGP